VSRFVRALKSRGWGTANQPLPTNWSGREKSYSEPKFHVTMGKEDISQIGVRQGVFSGTDEQVGSSSQSTVTRTNKNMYHTKDKDEMEEVVDEVEKVAHEHVGEEE